MKLKVLLLLAFLIAIPAHGIEYDEPNNLPPERTVIARIQEYLKNHPEIELAGAAGFSAIVGAVTGRETSAMTGLGAAVASMCAYGSYKLAMLNEEEEY
jgi:hypothetical protein